jgi:hypothetical protein
VCSGHLDSYSEVSIIHAVVNMKLLVGSPMQHRSNGKGQMKGQAPGPSGWQGD